MIMLLKGNLQMFGEDENLDISSMLDEFESEWTEETEEVEETETETEEVEETQEEAEPEVETTPEETPNPNDPEADKRNRAFADLRRERDEAKKYADFINRLAQDSGVTPEEILNRYEERRLSEQAQKENVPVEYLKRQTQTETELSELKERLAAERLDSQIKGVESKYGADEAAVRSTFEYMFSAGIDPRTSEVDFEKFYRAANLDSIIQKEVETARQKDLENKKKRQESASIPNGTSATQTDGDLDDEEFDKMLEKMGIRI
jgi:hypothetical protein